MRFEPSQMFEPWIIRLKVSWMGRTAQRIFGAFAASLGDRVYDFALQGVLEHMPSYANDPASIALMAGDRQLDTANGESTSDIAEREPFWLLINQFRGRALGLLLGLHFTGYDGAVVIVQNGAAWSLSLPLPDFVEGWDPTPNLVKQATSSAAVGITSNVTPPTATSAGRSIPADTAFARFDDNTDMCSRFSVVFPYPTSVSTADADALKAVIEKWRPAKATCVGVFAYGTAVGAWGWPVRKWGDGTKWGSTNVTRILGSF